MPRAPIRSSGRTPRTAARRRATTGDRNPGSRSTVASHVTESPTRAASASRDIPIAVRRTRIFEGALTIPAAYRPRAYRATAATTRAPTAAPLRCRSTRRPESPLGLFADAWTPTAGFNDHRGQEQDERPDPRRFQREILRARKVHVGSVIWPRVDPVQSGIRVQARRRDVYEPSPSAPPREHCKPRKERADAAWRPVAKGDPHAGSTIARRGRGVNEALRRRGARRGQIARHRRGRSRGPRGRRRVPAGARRRRGCARENGGSGRVLAGGHASRRSGGICARRCGEVRALSPLENWSFSVCAWRVVPDVPGQLYYPSVSPPGAGRAALRPRRRCRGPRLRHPSAPVPGDG